MKPKVPKFNKMIAIKPPNKNGKPKGVKKQTGY